jgi:hypothetical protein
MHGKAVMLGHKRRMQEKDASCIRRMHSKDAFEGDDAMATPNIPSNYTTNNA